VLVVVNLTVIAILLATSFSFVRIRNQKITWFPTYGVYNINDFVVLILG